MIWGDNNSNNSHISNGNMLNISPIFSNLSNNGSSQLETLFRKRDRFNSSNELSITSPDEEKMRYSKKSHFGEDELIKSLSLRDVDNISSKSVKRTIFDNNNNNNNNNNFIENENNQDLKKPNLSIFPIDNSFNMNEEYDEEQKEDEKKKEKNHNQNFTNLEEFNCIETQFNLDLLNNIKVPKYSRKVDALIDNVIRKSSRSIESYPVIPLYATRSPGSFTRGSRGGFYVRDDFDSCIPNSVGPNPCADHSISKFISNDSNNTINPHIKLITNQNNSFISSSTSTPSFINNNNNNYNCNAKKTHSGELTHTDWHMEEIEFNNEEQSLYAMTLSDNEEYNNNNDDDGDDEIVDDLDFEHD